MKENINNVPQEKKDIAKKFKAYKPGYLHIDVTYLPKFEGQSYYSFVAIDRATRTMFYEDYENKKGWEHRGFHGQMPGFLSGSYHQYLNR